jgi:hypothetical protein
MKIQQPCDHDRDKLFLKLKEQITLIDCLIDWCLTSTLEVFQLYRGVNKFYINLRTD